MDLKQVDPLTFRLVAFIKEQADIALKRYLDEDRENVSKHVELGRSKAFTECLRYYNELLNEE